MLGPAVGRAMATTVLLQPAASACRPWRAPQHNDQRRPVSLPAPLSTAALTGEGAGKVVTLAGARRRLPLAVAELTPTN